MSILLRHHLGAAALAVALLSAAPVLAQVINARTQNPSATIATGNTFQTILAAPSATSPGRRSLTIQNNNATDSCWIDFGVNAGGTTITAGNATKGESILLSAGGGSFQRYYPYIPSDEIEGTCATSNDTLHVDYQ